MSLDSQKKDNDNDQADKYTKREYRWPGVLFQLYTGAAIIYGTLFLIESKPLTFLFELILILAGLFGVTAGAHRLWAHQSYKATPTLRLFLMLCHTLSMQESIYDWVLNHRLHHKFHGTDNDPFNFKRGWFYAHIGNHLLAEHPKKSELIKEIDMSDIEKDKIVMFQKRYYWIMIIIVALILPINAPAEYWGESVINSIMTIGIQRIAITLQLSYLVNSAQTIWGLTPGDRFFLDSNWVYVITKSYWLEYHYTVPWDYLTNEYGSYNSGCTTVLIKILAALGMAYNLRTIDSKGMRMALERCVHTGKPIQECINEVGEEREQYLPEDHYLDSRIPGDIDGVFTDTSKVPKVDLT